jgi:hypothetical protein
MHRRTRTGLTLVAGLIMVAAALGTAGDAQATTRSAQATPSTSSALACIGTPAHFYLQAVGYPAGTYLGGNTPWIFCQVPISAGSSIVTLYLSVTGSPNIGNCLAYNATGEPKIYAHVPTGCGNPSLTYLQWKFHLVGTDANGAKEYTLQSMYAPSGMPYIGGVYELVNAA